MKHPHSRADRRRRKALAANRFRDHAHENETKKYKLQKQALTEKETGYENLDLELAETEFN